MIKHIVFWNLKAENHDANLAKLKSDLEALPAKIPEIRDFEVGLNFNPADAAFEVALYSTFDSREAMQAYQQHPDHQELLSFVKGIVSDRAVVDYEIP